MAILEEVVVFSRMLGEHQDPGAGFFRRGHDLVDLSPAVVGEGRVNVQIGPEILVRSRPLDILPLPGKRLDRRMHGREPLDLELCKSISTGRLVREREYDKDRTDDDEATRHSWFPRQLLVESIA